MEVNMTTTSDVSTEMQDKLDAVYPLTDQQVAFYEEYGFIKLKHVLSPDVL